MALLMKKKDRKRTENLRETSTVVKGFTMNKVVIGSVVLLMLAACSGGSTSGSTGSDGNEEAVCGEQSDWARSGTIGGGDITITCPGNARPGY